MNTRDYAAEYRRRLELMRARGERRDYRAIYARRKRLAARRSRQKA